MQRDGSGRAFEYSPFLQLFSPLPISDQHRRQADMLRQMRSLVVFNIYYSGSLRPLVLCPACGRFLFVSCQIFLCFFFFSIRVKRADAWASVIIMLQIVFDIRESTDGCAQRAHIAHITTFGYYVVVDGLPFFCFSFSPFQFVIRCIRTRRGHITYERTHTHGLGKDDECD